jgi:hypothetical protein
MGKRMKHWDLARFVAVTEIGASIGVMVSVIYLAIQIHGGNQQLRAQSYQSTLEMLHKPLELVVQDQSLADMVVRAEAEPESLTTGEWQRYSDLQLLRFDAYEHAYYAHGDGEIREELWQGIDSSFSSRMASRGFQEFWARMGSAFAEPFHGFVEAKLRQ